MAASAGTPILNNNGAGATTVTLALTCTAAGAATFVVNWDAGFTLSSVGSSQGKTYTLRGTEQTINGGKARVYTAENMNSGAETITVTFSGSNVAVIAGVPVNGTGASSYDGIGGPTADAVSPWTSADVTPSTTNTLLVSMAVNDSTNASTNWTAGNSFIDGVEEGDGSTLWPLALSTKAVSSTSPDHGSWTASQGTNAIVWTVAFKGATVAAGAMNNLLLLGCS